MSSDLAFACQCGTVSGTLLDVGPGQGDHVICHCTDCQDLTRHLGHASHVLDAHGGSALYQSRCARMRLTSGRDRLACVHLTDKPTLRWYATCCNMPVFNSYANGKIPYITTQLAACDPATRAALVGPPLGHLFTHDGIGDTSALPRMSMGQLMRRFFPRMIKDMLSGDRRRCELFDAKTLQPIAEPRRLTAEERQALREGSTKTATH
ncbi:hypothetical protein ASD67_16870 [Sphingopyxis sp. Root1497]|uniref:DUF6151 family protein n=1 Tax=Sphingopyxis sp. Root1497 TaxID=1736474 RepID=UPI000701354F|nr:DUF6151 family protein [Sphingopyxis sp. Root1497]KQZ60961.1 hypothetical protein ASD67_16870 [Sphingopyxis sp. Root1497]